MEKGWGMTRVRKPGFPAPCFGPPWGSGEHVGEIHQHLAPAKRFWQLLANSNLHLGGSFVCCESEDV